MKIAVITTGILNIIFYISLFAGLLKKINSSIAAGIMLIFAVNFAISVVVLEEYLLKKKREKESAAATITTTMRPGFTTSTLDTTIQTGEGLSSHTEKSYMKKSHKIILIIFIILAALLVVLRICNIIPYDQYRWVDIIYYIPLAIYLIYYVAGIIKDLEIKAKDKNKSKNKN